MCFCGKEWMRGVGKGKEVRGESGSFFSFLLVAGAFLDPMTSQSLPSPPSLKYKSSILV